MKNLIIILFAITVLSCSKDTETIPVDPVDPIRMIQIDSSWINNGTQYHSLTAIFNEQHAEIKWYLQPVGKIVQYDDENIRVEYTVGISNDPIIVIAETLSSGKLIKAILTLQN